MKTFGRLAFAVVTLLALWSSAQTQAAVKRTTPASDDPGMVVRCIGCSSTINLGDAGLNISAGQASIAIDGGSVTVMGNQTSNWMANPNNRLTGAKATMQFDVAGNLQARAQVLTDEGMFSDGFEGTSIFSTLGGTATFTNGSVSVVGIGTTFTSTLDTYRYVKLSAASETAWARVSSVDDDTHLTLVAPYTGATGTSTMVQSNWATTTAAGASITVANSTLTLVPSTGANDFTAIYRSVDYSTLNSGLLMHLNGRNASESVFVGYTDIPTLTSSTMATYFVFEGTDPTKVKCETRQGPDGSLGERATTVTIPGGSDTSVDHNYEISVGQDRVAFYIDGILVATHQDSIPDPYKTLTFAFATSNSASGLASPQALVVSWVHLESIDRVDTVATQSVAARLQAQVQGAAKIGDPLVVNPVVIGGTDGTGVRAMKTYSDGTLTTYGTKQNNATAADDKNMSVLPAISTAAAPVYTSGNQVALSTDLSGALRVLVTPTTSSVSQGSTWQVQVDGGVNIANYPATSTAPISVRLTDGTSFYTASGGGGGTASAVTVDGGYLAAYQGGVWQVQVDGGVNIGNWPATQAVTGSVSVSNFPGTQPVSIASMPSTPVTGSFWQATQPVSIATMPSTPVTGTFWQATQPISGAVTTSGTATVSQATGSNLHVVVDTAPTTTVTGTVTANAGTGTMAVSAAALPLPTGAATETTLAKTAIAQSAALGSNTQTMVGGSVTTAAPTYTTGNINPLSLTTTGALRTDSSATTQPVSGTMTVTQATGTNMHVVVDTAPSTAVTGTVTANIGTSGALALDATLTGGSQKTKLVDTGGVNVGSISAAGALKVDNSAVTQPVSGAVTVSGTATVSQATGSNLHVVVDTAPTTAVTGTFWQATQPVSGTVTANAGTGTMAVSAATLPLPTGASTEATVAKLPIAQSTALGTNAQVLSGASVTTAAPTYVTGNVNPLSLNTAGGLRVDGSGVTQPVSGTVTANAGSGTMAVSATSLPLPTGAATETTLGTRLADATFTGRFPSASLLADGVSNPTISAVSVFLNGYNGTTWDRLRSSTANGLVVDVSRVQGTVAATQSGTWNVGLSAGTNYFGKARLTDGTLDLSMLNSAPVSDTGQVALPVRIISSLAGGGGGGSVTGTLTNNGGASSSNNLGTLPAVATTAAPSYTNGNQVALSTDLTGALRVSGSSGGGVANTQVRSAANAWTDVGYYSGNLNMPVQGGKTSNSAVPGATNVGTLPAVASTAAPSYSDGNQVALSTDLTGALRVAGTISATNPSVSTTGSAPPASATYMGGSVTTSAPTYTTGQMSGLSLTTAGAVRTDSSGTTQPVSGSVTVSGTATVSQATGSNLHVVVDTAPTTAVTGSFWQATQPVSGTVTANAGTGTMAVSAASLPLPSGAATETSLAKLPIAQSVALGTNTQVMSGGSVTTAAPTYTTGNINPLSLNTAGGLRVDGSGVTQPVSGSVTVSGTTTVTQATGSNLHVVVDTAPSTAVTGTVTANAGTGTFAVSAASLPLPTGAATEATLAKVPVAQSAALGSNSQVMVGGSVTTAAPTYTNGNINPLSLTTTGALRTDSSATTQPVSGSVTVSGTTTVTQATGSNLHVVVDTAPSTAVTGTVTANAGTGTFAVSAAALPLPTGAATEATLAKLPIAQSAALGANTQVMSGGSVTTAAPTYTTGNINPLSLTTAGGLRVDGSGTTQPVSGSVTVSGTVTANAGTGTMAVSAASLPLPSGAATETSLAKLPLAQASTTSGQSGALMQGAVATAAPTYTTATTNPLSLTTAGALRVDASATTQPVSGTVTANAGSGNYTVVQATAASLNATVTAPGTASASQPGSCSSVTTTAVVLASNASRRAGTVCARITNSDTAFVSFSGTATTSSFPLEPGQCMGVGIGGGTVYTGAVAGIANSGSQTLCTIELQ